MKPYYFATAIVVLLTVFIFFGLDKSSDAYNTLYYWFPIYATLCLVLLAVGLMACRYGKGFLSPYRNLYHRLCKSYSERSGQEKSAILLAAAICTGLWMVVAYIISMSMLTLIVLDKQDDFTLESLSPPYLIITREVDESILVKDSKNYRYELDNGMVLLTSLNVEGDYLVVGSYRHNTGLSVTCVFDEGSVSYEACSYYVDVSNARH